MSFGVVQSMIASLRSNRNLLNKRSKLKGTLSGKESGKLEFKSSGATPEKLKKIKERLQLENQRNGIKQILFICVNYV